MMRRIIEVNVSNVPVHQKLHRDTSTTCVWLNIMSTLKIICLEEL